jgi:hypothetical protein
MPPTRKAFLLRIDPSVLDAVQRWANDDLRSLNGQIEFVLRRALAQAGRAPARAGAAPSTARPDSAEIEDEAPADGDA